MNFEPAELNATPQLMGMSTIRDEADSMFVSWFTTNGAFNNITRPIIEKTSSSWMMTPRYAFDSMQPSEMVGEGLS